MRVSFAIHGRACASLAALLLFSSGGLAAAPPTVTESAPFRSAHGRASLLSSVDRIAPGQAWHLALRLRLDPGWHTYWMNPGDSGSPAILKWTLPPGFAVGETIYPTPERIEAGPLVSYGHHGEVLLIAPVQAPQGFRASTIPVALKAEWLECADVCIPAIASFSIGLPVAPSASGSDHEPPEPLRTALALQPRNMSALAEVRLTADTVELRMTTPPGLRLDPAQVYVFFDQAGLVDHAAKQHVELNNTELRIIAPRSFQEAPADRFDAVISLGDAAPGAMRAESWRIAGEFETGAGAAAVALALLLAFAGGILLNLMPCVLPALSLKALSFVQHAGESRGKLFAHGLSFAGGVLLSFWILAVVLLALRAGGEAAGWGFQMQSPYFVAAMAWFFTLLALNLFGLFEPGLALSRLGALPEGRSPMVASFLHGLVATAAATPCTAPFMGSALGFAMQQNAAISLAVFSALGAGMSAPYLALAAFPSLLRFVPRPGAWMERLKQFLAFLLLATTLWLAWTLSRLSGADAAMLVLGGALLLALALWIFALGRAQQRRWLSRATGLVVLALSVLATIGGADLHSAPETQSEASGEERWQEYSPERLAELQAAGRPVFVNFTADWCLSCKVNEALVFGDERVWQAMAAADVVALKADWTRRDEAIARELERHGRSGVPLYVLYDGRGGKRFLSEALSPGETLDALGALKDLD